MALSKDCLDYRDRQHMRTQRWVLWGMMGAVGIHIGGLLMLRWSPSDAAQLATEDRIQVTVLPSPAAIAETATPTTAAPTTAARPAVSPSSPVITPSPSSQTATSSSSAIAVAPVSPRAEPSEAVDSPDDSTTKTVTAVPESQPEVIAPSPDESSEIAEDESMPEPPEDSLADAEVAEALPDLEAIADTLPIMADADAPLPSEAPSPAASEDAMSGNGAALESANRDLTDALSRLSENRDLSGAAASSNATAPTGHPSTPVARSTGPDPARPGNSSATDSPDAGSEPANGGDRTVSCRQCHRPAYPPAALEAGIEGQPVVNVQFDASGHVIGVTLEQSSGHAALDQAALSSLQSWQFETGGQGGSVSVEIPFVIEGSQRHRAAQQQGDRESATVTEDTPTAERSPSNQPVQSAAESPTPPSDADEIVEETAGPTAGMDTSTEPSPRETEAGLETRDADNPAATDLPEISDDNEATPLPADDEAESVEATPESPPEPPAAEPNPPAAESVTESDAEPTVDTSEAAPASESADTRDDASD